METTEVSFEGLPLGDSGLTLKGKVDRIDSHPREGMVIWDYKTGAVPISRAVFEEKVVPQLPAYLLALMRNFIPGVNAREKTVKAGYIPLKKASEIKITPLGKKIDWGAFLREWELAVQERIKEPLKGLFLPDPRPSPVESSRNACKYCSYLHLCNYFARGEGDENEESET
jgi:ATP-dependent helicase/DNAse subunit B